MNLALQKYALPCNFDVLIPIFDVMHSKIKNWVAISLLPQVLLVKWLAGRPDLVERYYSEGIYPVISRFFRTIYGWIPFSMGDIFYLLLSILAIRYLILNRRKIRSYPLVFLRNVAFVLSIAYFTFHLMWGLNYYRLPIADRFSQIETHTDEELVDMIEALVIKTNQLQYSITKDTSLAVEIPFSQQEIFEKTMLGYSYLGKAYPFLSYERPSIKKSLFSTALTYMGYGGYINPFTNEGQVNGRLPNFRFPVVSGHEIGHQVGYSAENETNFIGYLATIHNPDPYFQYSAYAYALGYGLNDLRFNDEEKFKELYLRLNPGIRKNFQEMATFWESFENPLEPVFKSVFNAFLKANNQPKGIKSYNAVVSLMVNYHKQHPL